MQAGRETCLSGKKDVPIDLKQSVVCDVVLTGSLHGETLAALCVDMKTTVRMSRKMNQTQKNVVGDFGGYISQAQLVGLHERNNRNKSQYLKVKLSNRKSNPTNQMSHAVMRMCTALEAKGIMKPITQELQLAAKYH